MEFDNELNQLDFNRPESQTLALIPFGDQDREIELNVGESFLLAPDVSLTLGDLNGNCLLETTKEAIEDNNILVDNMVVGEVFHLGPENILELNGLKYKIAPRETPVIVENLNLESSPEESDSEIFDAEFSEYEQQELNLDLEEDFNDELEGNIESNDDLKFTEEHHDELDMGLDEFEEWEEENLLEEESSPGYDGKRLRIYLFSFLLVTFFGLFSWFNFSKLENKYLSSMNFITDGLKGRSAEQVDLLKKDYQKLKLMFEQRLAHALGEIEELNKKNQKKTVKRRIRPRKKVAKVAPVMKKAELHKPLILLSENDKETILKEVEILKLESRLDPFSAREDLINLKSDLNDKDLIKVIDNVLRQI